MKSYPSIPTTLLNKEIHVFKKYDGSNFRAEWNIKKGWYKFGSRTELINKNHPILGCGIDAFLNTSADYIGTLCKNNKWNSVVIFAELWGEHSFAGEHVPQDEKFITLFDINVERIGFLKPEDYLQYFKDFKHSAKYLGKHIWDENLIKKVREGTFNGMSFEGVVGKYFDEKKNKILMTKAKNQKWIDAVIAKHGEQKAKTLI